MRDVVIVADPGSTWMGKKQYGFELIRLAKECGADAIKFQLFQGPEFTKTGNIEMPLETFSEFFLYGKSIQMPVTASVFGDNELKHLLRHDVHHIKFGYSQRERTETMIGLSSTGRRIVASVDFWTARKLGKRANLVRLKCYGEKEAVYPTEVILDFEGAFLDDGPYEGFSDHSLGIGQSIEAVKQGAKWIERHIRLNYSDCDKVPDGAFALKPKEFERLCRTIK